MYLSIIKEGKVMAKQKLKTIDPHKDYVMSSMTFNAYSSIRILIDYMQERTPYGEAYVKAFGQGEKVLKELEKFVDLLEDTVELRCKEEEK